MRKLFRRTLFFCHRFCQVLTDLKPTSDGVFGNRESFAHAHPELVSLPRWFKNHGYDTLVVCAMLQGARGYSSITQWPLFVKPATKMSDCGMPWVLPVGLPSWERFVSC